MAWLQLDKAPFVLTFLLSLLGWHVTQIVDEVRGTHAVTYDIHSTKEEYKVTIQNVSKKKSLVDAQFMVSCPGLVHCLQENSANIIAFPPTFVPPSGIEGDRSFITTTVTMGLDGKFGLKVKRSPGMAAPKLFFVPNADQPIDIYMTDSGSFTGFVVTHYLSILLWTFVLLFVLFVLAWLNVLKSKPEAEKSASTGKSRTAIRKGEGS
jgi:hypothetical protein